MTSLNKTIVYLVYVQHQKNIDRLLGSSCRRSIPCIYVYRKKYALWLHKPFVWGALQFIGKYKEYIASQMNEEINFMIFFFEKPKKCNKRQQVTHQNRDIVSMILNEELLLQQFFFLNFIFITSIRKTANNNNSTKM